MNTNRLTTRYNPGATRSHLVADIDFPKVIVSAIGGFFIFGGIFMLFHTLDILFNGQGIEMKLRMNVYITNFEAFLRGDYNSLNLDTGRHMDGKWQFVGEVELNIEPDTGAMIEVVAKELDETIASLHNAIQVAENRKAELLALPSPS